MISLIFIKNFSYIIKEGTTKQTGQTKLILPGLIIML